MPSTFGVGMRYLLIRRLACRCGEVVAVFPDVYLFGLQNTKIGNHVSIHPMCYLDGTGGLTIGSNVSIAHGVTIMTTEHSYEQRDTFIRDAPMQCLPVEIGDDVWIGAGARILAGVRIGDGVVIGAGAVITRDVPDNSVVAGVPGRVIKQRWST